MQSLLDRPLNLLAGQYTSAEDIRGIGEERHNIAIRVNADACPYQGTGSTSV